MRIAHDATVVASYYVAVCAARQDAYAAWTGEHWSAVREPLTAEVVISAFERKKPVSGYMIDADNSTHIAALDIDLDNGWEIGQQVGQSMWNDGVPAYLERSRRGAHLWLFLDRVMPAIVVRRALRSYLDQFGLAENPKVELRPGSDRVSSDGLGHALRMPSMPHQSTGQRGFMCDPRTGESLGTKLADFLLVFEDAPADRIVAAAERYHPMIDPRSIPSRYRKPKAYDDAPSVVAVLAEIGVNAIPGRAVRCPFHDDKHPSLSIARDEARAFCKSPECPAHNYGRGLGSNQLAALVRGRAG
jgi:hypothetical protein